MLLNVALILEKLRMEDPDATVDDALDQLDGVQATTTVHGNTDTLTTSWRGEWAQLTNGSNPLSDSSYATDQHHRIFIPADATFLRFDLNYNPLDLNSGTGGSIDATVDWDGDGNNDIGFVGGDMAGQKHYELDLTVEPQSEFRGRFWTFNVEGDGIKAPYSSPDDEFHEALIEYTIELWLILQPDSRITLDETDYLVDASPWRFGDPSPAYGGATISLRKEAFKISDVEKEESFYEQHGDTIPAFIIIFMIGLIGGFLLLKRQLYDDENGDNAPVMAIAVPEEREYQYGSSIGVEEHEMEHSHDQAHNEDH